MAGVNLMMNKSSIIKSSLHWPKGISVFSLPKNYNPAISFSCNKLYATYPIHSFSLIDGEAVLEGMVYNVALPNIALQVQQLFTNPKIDIKKVQQATASWTGEWCLWVQKGSDLYIFNDSLGRLPVYWHNSDTHFFTGRHLAFLTQNKLLVPDKMSVSSMLWSGYLIGHRTIYKDVKRLPGGSFIHVNVTTAHVDITAGRQFNFDERNNEPLQQQAAQLAFLFKQGCNRISDSWPGLINISQSGGQDSRAVAVGFKEAVKEDNRLIASSFIMHGSERDASLGKAIADALHIPFSSYEVQGNATYEAELLANKMGMNYVAMAFIHDFYKQMLQKNSNFLYVTGDGGDKALPYLGEKNRNISTDELVAQLSQRHATTPVPIVSALTGVSKDEILQLIYETVSSYPEQKANNKSIHFTIYERAVQCFFEGEDRSRYFAWATTPFYDLDFFKAAMQVPDSYKKHYTIYRPFQNALSKSIADIPDASGHSINSWKFIARKRVQELFRSAPPPVKNIVRKLGGVPISVNKGTPEEQLLLINQLSDFTAMKSILDPEVVASFFKTANQEQYEYLRTLILLEKFINPQI
jgi:asparagine synthase (glutamine-hydrolysing)